MPRLWYRLKAPLNAFHTEGGRVIHQPSGSFSLAKLAAAASRYSPSPHPKLKLKSQYTLVGKPVPRIDIPAKVNGTTQYGMDVQLPGLHYAAIKISPIFGGKLVSVNEASIAGNPGIKKVIKLDDAVVVVADRFWRAQRAADVLETVFSDAGNSAVSSNSIRQRHLQALNQEQIKHEHSVGAGAKALQDQAVLERVYHVPYLAHAAMEPVNATAQYNASGRLKCGLAPRMDWERAHSAQKQPSCISTGDLSPYAERRRVRTALAGPIGIFGLRGASRHGAPGYSGETDFHAGAGPPTRLLPSECQQPL